MAAAAGDAGLRNDLLAERFRHVRAASLGLCDTLSAEDQVVQTMPDVSPTKWHLAHTTWFFERFVLERWAQDYTPFDARYAYLFNSYYQTAGDMHARPNRGLLSRPTVAEIVDYRAHVDEAVAALLASCDDTECAFVLELGLNHERQHQELMLTDIKHVLSCRPNAKASPASGRCPGRAQAARGAWPAALGCTKARA